MSKIEQIEEMARDLSEATSFASRTLLEETKAFVKEFHRYHSKDDFDKAHEKSMSELEAEHLYNKGYRKSEYIAKLEQDVTRLVQEKNALVKNYAECMKDYARDIFEEIEEITMHGITSFGLQTMTMGEVAFDEIKKKYTEGEKDNG